MANLDEKLDLIEQVSNLRYEVERLKIENKYLKEIVELYKSERAKLCS